jgi:hypothetical protein
MAAHRPAAEAFDGWNRRHDETGRLPLETLPAQHARRALRQREYAVAAIVPQLEHIACEVCDRSKIDVNDVPTRAAQASEDPVTVPCRYRLARTRFQC